MNANQIVDIIHKSIASIGIIAGGIFAYYKFIKGRIFRLKLEPTVSGEIFQKKGNRFLKVTINLKNIGVSNFRIEEEGSALIVYISKNENEASEIRKFEWEDFIAFDVFDQHKWIESGETVGDRLLITLPSKFSNAIKMEPRIVSKGVEWSSSSIIIPD